MKTMLAVAVLTFAATMPLLHPAPVVNGPYSVSVTIRPTTSANPYQLLAAQTPPPHTCTVEITDLGKHETLRGPVVVLTPGEHESKTRFISGYDIKLNASLSLNAQRAWWDVTMRRNGDVVVSQKSDMELRVTRSER